MDKVKLYPQERLDLDDTRALQSLVYDYSEETLGAVIGHNGGVLSVPTVTHFENGGAPYLTLSSFSFVSSTPVEASAQNISSPSTGVALTLFKNRIVTYFPDEQASNQISYDVQRQFYQDWTSSSLYARPVYIDTDTATRRKWDSVAGAEVSFSDETRESQRVEFTWGTSEPTYSANESKWTRIALLSSFTDDDNTGSTANLSFISVWDAPEVAHVNNILESGGVTSSELNTENIQTALNSKAVYQGRSYRSLDLPALLSAFRGQFSKILGSSGTNKWYTSPVQSLTQLTNRLITLEAQPTGGVYALATGRVFGVFVTGTQGQMTYSLGTSTSRNVKTVHSLPNGTAQNRVNIELADSLFQAGSQWNITHVSCTQIVNYQAQTGGNDYNRVTFMANSNSFGDTQQSNEVILDTVSGSSLGRGVVIELFPHIVDTTHGHDEDNIENVNGVTANRTPLLSELASATPFQNYEVVFTFTVYGVPY